jgi:hypothetical protein
VPSTKRPQDKYKSETVTSLLLSDDPAIEPFPDGAGHVDSVLVRGTGEWNGTVGYRYEVAAADRGEPAKGRESIRIRIWDPAGTVVVDVEEQLGGGNIQAIRQSKRK